VTSRVLCRQIWPSYSICKTQCACKGCPVFAVVKNAEQRTPPECRAHGSKKEHATADVVRALQHQLQARGQANDTCILQQLPLCTSGPQNKRRKGMRSKVDLGVLHVKNRSILGLEVHGGKEHVPAERRRARPRTEFGSKSRQSTGQRDERKRKAWLTQASSSGNLHEIPGAKVLKQTKRKWCGDMTQALQARLHTFLANVTAD
jgi:hypothetical protein